MKIHIYIYIYIYANRKNTEILDLGLCDLRKHLPRCQMYVELLGLGPWAGDDQSGHKEYSAPEEITESPPR